MFLLAVFIVSAFIRINAVTLPSKAIAGMSSSLVIQADPSPDADELVAHTKHGSYHGFKATDGVRAWLGVRYAVPPLADGRFEHAKALPNSTSQIETHKFGQSCIQDERPVGIFKKLLPFEIIVEGEDCLSLNIWAPTRPRNSNGRVAVLVWVSCNVEPGRPY